MLVGTKGASEFSWSKNTSLACVMAVNRLAMMVDVRIATSMDPDRSPSTTIGCSNGSLENNHNYRPKSLALTC